MLKFEHIYFYAGVCMHQILSWPFSDTLKLSFFSSTADLGTITCCDLLSIVVQYQDQSYNVATGVSGCSFVELKKLLEKFISQDQRKIQFKEFFLMTQDQCDNILLELRKQDLVVCYQLISVSMVQAWIAQLDLLEILMQENENEKKIQGKGCC